MVNTNVSDYHEWPVVSFSGSSRPEYIYSFNYVTMLLVVCQLSRDVIGYEDS